VIARKLSVRQLRNDAICGALLALAFTGAYMRGYSDGLPKGSELAEDRRARQSEWSTAATT
jgi:hypothetical protein